MRVWAELGPQGAGQGAARGDVVVVVDALRASVTIAAALRAGARRVIPVQTVEEAHAYLADPDCRVAGERGGARLPRFHYGNSPTEIWAQRAEVAGRTLVLTTSNGTRCVHAALGGAAAVLVGSTVNAGAVSARAFARAGQRGCDVTLVAAGLGGGPADEDRFAQGVLAGRLVRLGAVLAESVAEVCEADSQEVFARSGAAARLTELGYGEDVLFCSQIDVWDTVPIYRQDGFYSL